MPRAPVYGGRKVQTAPLPGVQANPNAPAAAFGVAGPNPFAGALAVASDIVQQETMRADRLAITEAENERVAIENDLTREASERFKGKEALLAAAWVESKRRERLAPVTERLNARQRDVFSARASRAEVELLGRVERYASEELDRHETAEYATGLQNRIDAGVADPAKAPGLLAEGRAMIAAYAKTRGLGPEQIAKTQGEFASKLHSAVVARYMNEGRDQEAEAYLAAHREEFVGADRLRVEKEVEQITTDGTANRAVDEVWATLGPKALTDPVKLADMEAWIREKYGDRPNVIKAARQELRTRVQAHEEQEREVTAQRKDAVLLAYQNGAGLASIKRMPEFRALGGADQEQLSRFIVDRGRALSDRARAEERRRQGEVTWRIAQSPESVANMSEAQIRARLPQIGMEGVDALLSMRKSLLGDPSKVYAANLDNTTFKHLLQQANIEDEGDQGALWLAMHRAVEQVQQEKGRFLTHTERQEVMQGVIDNTVLIDRFGPGTGGREEIAALVDEDDRGDAYVPLTRVPPQVVTEGLNYLRSIGTIPPNMSDAQARERFGRRIERAYGRRVTGATSSEIEAALRGTR